MMAARPTGGVVPVLVRVLVPVRVRVRVRVLVARVRGEAGVAVPSR
jgi:hypothetical protein